MQRDDKGKITAAEEKKPEPGKVIQKDFNWLRNEIDKINPEARITYVLTKAMSGGVTPKQFRDITNILYAIYTVFLIRPMYDKTMPSSFSDDFARKYLVGHIPAGKILAIERVALGLLEGYDIHKNPLNNLLQDFYNFLSNEIQSLQEKDPLRILMKAALMRVELLLMVKILMDLAEMKQSSFVKKYERQINEIININQEIAQSDMGKHLDRVYVLLLQMHSDAGKIPSNQRVGQQFFDIDPAVPFILEKVSALIEILENTAQLQIEQGNLQPKNKR